MKTDEEYMRRAIELARRGEGWCHPNPMVGAVIVKDGRIIGEGWHQKCGELHAERNAIRSLRESAEGATIYVTLEPCCHWGRTPPCTQAIIENKMARVVIGSRDPNPKVHGKGAAQLRKAGIEVQEDFLREECDALNPVFFHYITTKLPYVRMKYAMTADGKIATKTGASKWITGEESRARVQQMRNANMGIMAGIGTVLADDPMLNCRIENGRSPVRIICDSVLRIPPESRIVQTAKQYETFAVSAIPDLPDGLLRFENPDTENPEVAGIEGKVGAESPEKVGIIKEKAGTEISGKPGTDKKAVTEYVPTPGQAASGAFAPDRHQEVRSPEESRAAREDLLNRMNRIDPALRNRIEKLAEAGVKMINVPDAGGKTDLRKLMKILGSMEVDSILLEGGGTLNDSALRAGIVREVDAFVAPKLFGGKAKSPVEGTGVEMPDQAQHLEYLGTEEIGEDLLIRYLVQDMQQ